MGCDQRWRLWKWIFKLDRLNLETRWQSLDNVAEALQGEAVITLLFLG